MLMCACSEEVVVGLERVVLCLVLSKVQNKRSLTLTKTV